jgi:hypothetical protein
LRKRLKLESSRNRALLRGALKPIERTVPITRPVHAHRLEQRDHGRCITVTRCRRLLD